jgi:hypothetical protein
MRMVKYKISNQRNYNLLLTCLIQLMFAVAQLPRRDMQSRTSLGRHGFQRQWRRGLSATH